MTCKIFSKTTIQYYSILHTNNHKLSVIKVCSMVAPPMLSVD